MVVYLIMTAFLPLTFGSCNDDSYKEERLVNMLPETRAVQLSAEQKRMVEGNNDFAFKLFNEIYASAKNQGAQSENIVASPLGIAYSLGMLNAGAEGTTKSEIQKFLGFEGATDDAVNSYFAALLKQLPEADKGVTLLTSNALYLDKRYSLDASYQNAMRKYFDAELATLDFGKQEEVLNKINSWVRQKPQSMIPTGLNTLRPTTVVCLLNAIYFKGDWTSKFDKEQTIDSIFTTENGKEITVPMMHNKVAINATENENFSMVSIPFGRGDAWHMHVLLPKDTKNVADVLQSLDNASWQNTLRGMRPRDIDLKMPRFTTNTTRDMIPILKNCGIRQIFTNNSQLSKICKKKDRSLTITDMMQKVIFGVDEDGVKMATITETYTGETSVGPLGLGNKGWFYADSPFVYIISEASSGVILTMGVYQGN